MTLETTPQAYVDAQIAWHEQQAADTGIVAWLQVHGRAIAELRALRRRQWRPRLIVPAPLTETDLDRTWQPIMLVVDDAGPSFVDERAPATSPIYAELRTAYGWNG